MRARVRSALRGFWPAPLIAGVLQWASFPPLDQGWLAPIAWGVLLLSMRVRLGRRAGLQALVAALALYVPALSWIAPLVVPGWLFVALWCAAFEGLFGALLGRCALGAEGGPSPAWLLLAPLAHLLLDCVRTVLFTGFPWLLVGYTGWRNPVLLGSADLFGVHGATLAVLALAAGLAEAAARALEERPPRAVGSALAPAAAVWVLLGAWALLKPAVPEAPGPVVAVLQANIEQRLKEDLAAEGRDFVTAETIWVAHERLAEAAHAEAARLGVAIDAFVWPETMVPTYAARPMVAGDLLLTTEKVAGEWRLTERGARRVAAVARGSSTLAGFPTFGAEQRRWNTVVLLDSEGRYVAHQDKQHLTPGGEYIPYLDLLPNRQAVLDYFEEMAGFVIDMEPGEGPAPIPVPGADGTTRVGVLICYESLFPEISRRMAQEGADWLLNASNFGWFAGTSQMEQALALAAFRAAELRRSLVLASNNGISAVFGPDGRPREFARGAGGRRADVAAAMVARVPIGRGESPFAWWGERPAWFAGAAGAAGLLVLRRRRRSKREPEIRRPGGPVKGDPPAGNLS